MSYRSLTGLVTLSVVVSFSALVAIAEPVVAEAPEKPRLVVIVDDSFAGDVARGLAHNASAKGIWSVSVREVDAGRTSKADPYYGDYPYIVLADKMDKVMMSHKGLANIVPFLERAEKLASR
jgi:hypothetical protein